MVFRAFNCCHILPKFWYSKFVYQLIKRHSQTKKFYRSSGVVWSSFRIRVSRSWTPRRSRVTRPDGKDPWPGTFRTFPVMTRPRRGKRKFVSSAIALGRRTIPPLVSVKIKKFFAKRRRKIGHYNIRYGFANQIIKIIKEYLTKNHSRLYVRQKSANITPKMILHKI